MLRTDTDSIFTALEQALDNLPIECPISGEPMQHPVVTPCGHSFEEKSIEAWIKRGDKDMQGHYHNKCPECNVLVMVSQLRPNYALIPFLEFAKKQRNEFKKGIEAEMKAHEKMRAENTLLKKKIAMVFEVVQSENILDLTAKQKESLPVAATPIAFFTPEQKKEIQPESKKVIISTLKPEQQNEINITLKNALEKNDYENAVKALKAGANPNYIDPENNQPLLIMLTKAQELEGIQLLFEYGANINIKDKNGDTALHWIAYFLNPIITEALLERGADPRITNNAERNPLEELFANSRRHDDIELMLENRIKELKNNAPLLRV